MAFVLPLPPSGTDFLTPDRKNVSPPWSFYLLQLSNALSNLVLAAGGEPFQVQFNDNGLFGGIDNGTANLVLTSNGASLTPTFQATQNIFDQDLNTTDSPTFAALTIGDPLVHSIQLSPQEIAVSDDVTTAFDMECGVTPGVNQVTMQAAVGQGAADPIMRVLDERGLRVLSIDQDAEGTGSTLRVQASQVGDDDCVRAEFLLDDKSSGAGYTDALLRLQRNVSAEFFNFFTVENFHDYNTPANSYTQLKLHADTDQDTTATPLVQWFNADGKALSFDVSAPTANRTYAFPDASGTLIVNDVSNLPTSNPGPGLLWVDTGAANVLKMGT